MMVQSTHLPLYSTLTVCPLDSFTIGLSGLSRYFLMNEREFMCMSSQTFLLASKTACTLL
jgi:hypothetical protein